MNSVCIPPAGGVSDSLGGVRAHRVRTAPLSRISAYSFSSSTSTIRRRRRFQARARLRYRFRPRLFRESPRGGFVALVQVGEGAKSVPVSSTRLNRCPSPPSAPIRSAEVSCAFRTPPAGQQRAGYSALDRPRYRLRRTLAIRISSGHRKRRAGRLSECQHQMFGLRTASRSV